MLKVKQYRPFSHLISQCSLKVYKFSSFYDVIKIILSRKKNLYFYKFRFNKKSIKKNINTKKIYIFSSKR